MPELPEISAFCKNLHAMFAGTKLIKVKVVDDRHMKGTEDQVNEALAGQTLKEVYRSGKELRFRFANDVLLGMHVMLSGKMFLFEDTNPKKLTVVELYFDNGKAIALTDLMKQATIRLHPEDKEGVDALSKDLTLAYLRDACKLSPKTPIKNLLIDQDIIRGIGGAYSDEICWEIKVSPFSTAGAIPDDKIKELHKAIPKVLNRVAEQIYKNKPGIIAGDVREFSMIHNPKRTESPTGAPIMMEKLNGRKTYYTAEQVLYK